MNNYDIIIVGAGAAGLTAGIYAARAKKSVLILEKTAAGGQILNTTKVENYPGIDSISGQEFGEKLKSQVKKFGGELKTAEVSQITKSGDLFNVATDEGDFVAKSIILANGSRERRLGLDREAELTGNGVSYCATCDGALYKDQLVSVYGGGNTAAYSVLYLANICQKVFWIFRKPEPRAEKHLTEEIKQLKSVEILPETVIKSLRGDQKLQSIEFEDGSVINSAALFILIGREPDNARFENIVDLDD
ncbi:FAD-dependent oxidoreductase, partial [Candidatus Saccharibacteria bacterium]|nr:FAD-dependent oxidoreductase [Candidatus Saccharibacteria bacterium]